jgi:type I restriction enzyme R subunit
MAHTSFWGPDGKPISGEAFVRLLFGELPKFFGNEAELRALWSRPDTRRKLLDELAEKGFPRNQLLDLQRIMDAEKCDLYDVLAYIAFSQERQLRSDRAHAARSHFDGYDDRQRAFLDFVLDQEKLPALLLLKYKALPDATKQLGDIGRIRETFVGFQRFLYSFG